MARIFKPGELEYEQKIASVDQFAWHTSQKLTEAAGARHLKFDVRMLDPGKFSFPYHFHRNSEELFVILSGKAMLRTPEGFCELETGDIVYFEKGPEGAHQIYNHTEAFCRYLDLRTFFDLDVCEYPDSNKINILPDQEVYQTADRTDYFKGEERPEDRWPAEIIRQASHPSIK